MNVHALASAQVALFVPGNRPERFDKAVDAGADLTIFDLEDAVAPQHKDAARESVREWIQGRGHDRVVIRVNADGTSWHDDDLGLARETGCPIMVPKSEDAARLAATCTALGTDHPVNNGANQSSRRSTRFANYGSRQTADRPAPTCRQLRPSSRPG